MKNYRICPLTRYVQTMIFTPTVDKKSESTARDKIVTKIMPTREYIVCAIFQ